MTRREWLERVFELVLVCPEMYGADEYYLALAYFLDERSPA